MRRFAYLGESKEGGTYRVFETLRDSMGEYGWEGSFVGQTSVPALNGETRPDRRISILRDYLATFDAVIGNDFVDLPLMNILRYLPARLPRLLTVHSVTYATYRAARALRDSVQHTIAVSPRIGHDLVARLGFAKDRVSVILNAVPDNLFLSRDFRLRDGPVPILSLGRIENNAKRVFLIPDMLKGVDPEQYLLTIAGDGPDREELLQRLRSAGIQFEAPGRIEREDLPSIYGAHDIFLFPSKFEGMALTLAEAMSCGLLPIAARIENTTDYIVQSGKNGVIFSQGDVRGASQELQKLLADPGRRLAMQAAAQERARDLFSVTSMARSYAEVLDRVCSNPEPIPFAEPRDWKAPRALGPGLRSFIPTGLRRKIADALFYR